MRLSYDELEEIKKEYSTDRLWSFSRYSTFLTSKYEYFLQYVKHAPQENHSAYPDCGTLAHDVLEGYYEGKYTYDQCAEEYEDGFTTNTDILGLRFDRTDDSKNESIKEKYLEDMTHFFNNFKPLENVDEMMIEKFIPIKVDDNIVFQGYSDCIVKNGGIYTIIDFKTSSKYTGKAIDEHAAQLILYCEGLHQMLGIPRKEITACWMFFKYISLTYTLMSGTTKTIIVERRELGSKLRPKIEAWAKKLGCNIEKCMRIWDTTQDMSSLPLEIQDKFVIQDAYVYIDYNEDVWNKLHDEIVKTTTEIRKLEDEYAVTGDEHLFWDSDSKIAAESFYFANLSGYSAGQLKPYKEWLTKREKVDKIISAKKKKKEQENEDDMSWLDSLV